MIVRIVNPIYKELLKYKGLEIKNKSDNIIDSASIEIYYKGVRVMFNYDRVFYVERRYNCILSGWEIGSNDSSISEETLMKMYKFLTRALKDFIRERFERNSKSHNSHVLDTFTEILESFKE